MTNGIELQTKRLLLKQEGIESWEDILEFYKENIDSSYTYDMEIPKDFCTKQHQLARLSMEMQLTKSRSYLRLWLFEKDNVEKRIGTICFSDIFGKTATLSYQIAPLFQKQGYCVEACLQGLSLIKEQYQVNKAKAKVFAENLPSIKVLEHLQFSCIKKEKIDGKELLYFEYNL